MPQKEERKDRKVKVKVKAKATERARAKEKPNLQDQREPLQPRQINLLGTDPNLLLKMRIRRLFTPSSTKTNGKKTMNNGTRNPGRIIKKEHRIQGSSKSIRKL